MPKGDAMNTSRILLVALIAAVFVVPARAQVPPPIDLGVINIPQQTPVWCWAAVVEQVVRWRSGGSGPSQCQIVSAANGFPAEHCCGPAVGAPICLRPGGVQEMQQALFSLVNIRSSVFGPLSWQQLYQFLSLGRPVLVLLHSTPFSGHVVLVRGMFFVPQGPVLIVNDPMAYFSQPVPIQAFYAFWTGSVLLD